ncbi:MAG: hypothetical protein HOP18_09510 [Deltaproteobacteria bacterium]|nr:hypothetical protein [Deltaproteobacteria bacterium]
MKKSHFRTLVATAALVLGLSAAGSAHADIYGGFLGGAVPNASATDVYGVTCPIGTTSVQANVNDGAGAGVEVSVQVINPTGRAISASAPDSGGPSGLVVLAGGPGNYLVTVHKDALANEGYVVFMDCYIGAVAIAGNQSVLVQNQ